MGINESQRNTLVAEYRQQFLVSNSTPSQLYQGVTEMLQDLKSQGYLLAVATGKSRTGLRQVLDTTGLEPYFPVTRCADETCSKPDPMMLREILADYNLAPDQAVMIGDTEFDIQMGQRAGVDTVAVAQGAHSLQQLVETKPTAILDRINDLLSWLSSGRH
jgi:phosphoglycolate phosphatase